MSAIIMRSQPNRVRFPSIRDPHAQMAMYVSSGHEKRLFSPGSQKIAYPETDFYEYTFRIIFQFLDFLDFWGAVMSYWRRRYGQWQLIVYSVIHTHIDMTSECPMTILTLDATQKEFQTNECQSSECKTAILSSIFFVLSLVWMMKLSFFNISF